MVVKIVLVLILSTSFVIQKNVKNTLRTSEHSSASNVTPILNTRTPNTTGCHMNILTVSRHSFPAFWMFLRVDTLSTPVPWTLDPYLVLRKLGAYRGKPFWISRSKANNTFCRGENCGLVLGKQHCCHHY